MVFWGLVGVGYLTLLGIGLVIGRYLGSRRDEGGGRGLTAPVLPTPDAGPTFALDWPPLGSEFDRQLLPGAFDDAPVVVR